MTILIGCDPELFIYNTRGNPVSAHDLLPGSKWDPHIVEKGAVQVDGVAAEFNINPAASEEEFVGNIHTVLDQMIRMIRKDNDSLILKATPTIKFTRRQWESIPEDAKHMGCEPDYNAYSLTANTKPETDKFMRTGSGHVHISWGQTKESVRKSWLEHCATLVHHLDYHLYANSLLWDKDKERQELYGQPGAFRPKPYGLEYRVLSNKWVENDTTVKYVYQTTKLCTEKWLGGYKPDHYEVPRYAA
jgi:hypothetical protein